MPIAVFAKVLQQISGHTRHLCLHLLGEPLLHPELEAIFTLCAANDLQINLTSNGTLLGKRGELLLRSPALRQLNLSLHSLAASPEALETALAFVRESCEISPILFSLRLWNHTGAEDPTEQILLHRIATYFDLPEPFPVGPLPGQGISIAPRVYLSRQTPFIWPHAAAEIAQRGRCRALRDHLGILVDGTVVPCCLDAEGDIPLGNILTEPLDTILTAERAASMRAGFAANQLVEPLCRRCNYRIRFGRRDNK